MITARAGPTDSIEFIIHEIVEMSGSNTALCKNFTDFRYSIAHMNIEKFEDVIKDVRHFNTVFKEANKNKNCPLLEPVNRLLTALQSVNSTDSSSIKQAILYAKSRYSGYVRVQFEWIPHVKTPVIIQSAESYILPFQSDTTGIEFYILPGMIYAISISPAGFIPLTSNLLSRNDTIISVNLVKTESSPAENNQASEEKRVKSFWWIPVSLLFAGLLVFILRRSMFSGTQKKLNGTTLNQEILNKYQEEIEKLKSGQKGAGNELPSKKYFQSEIMMTAGPRKKMNVDRDLGEDVCGFIVSGNEVLAWLMDGSSDFFDPLVNPDTNREYFSSRLLAQSLGRKVRGILASPQRSSLSDELDKIIKQVRDEWLMELNALPDPEKSVLRKNLKDGVRPDCASTVLIMRVNINGDMEVCRTGDSKLLSFTAKNGGLNVDTTLASKNDKVGPVSFLLGVKDNDFDIVIRHSKPEITERNRIFSVIGFSDGIGKTTEKTLINEYAIDSDKARNEIISQLQGTGDDKALFIIDIKEF